MNGRIYDPKLGRFLQADPIVQAPKNSQNLNRYSYVLNNPLSYTDPTGHSFFKKYWRVIVAAVAVYVTAGLATPWIAGFAWGAGAAAGTLSVAGAAVVGAITGAVGGAILTGTLKGAFYGALTGAALGAVGASGLNQFGKTVAGGAANGITTELQGGKFGHGFLSAGAGMLTGVRLGGPPSFGKFLGAAIAGGTISELTGGKFANGAISAGLAYVIAAGAANGRGKVASASGGRDDNADTGTVTMLKACSSGDSVACSSLDAQNERDLSTVLSFLEEKYPHILSAFDGELPLITFDKSIGFWERANGETGIISGNITLSAGYNGVSDLAGTVGHELVHSSSGQFHRLAIFYQDKFGTTYPPYNVGSIHTEVWQIGDQIRDAFP